jgi:hypothetical protein
VLTQIWNEKIIELQWNDAILRFICSLRSQFIIIYVYSNHFYAFPRFFSSPRSYFISRIFELFLPFHFSAFLLHITLVRIILRLSALFHDISLHFYGFYLLCTFISNLHYSNHSYVYHVISLHLSSLCIYFISVFDSNHFYVYLLCFTSFHCIATFFPTFFLFPSFLRFHTVIPIIFTFNCSV